MKISKIEDDSILKHKADNQREQAKKTIEECVKQGVGVYEIVDDENVYPSRQRMFERLKECARRYDLFNKNDNLKVDVITRKNKEQILVVIKE